MEDLLLSSTPVKRKRLLLGDAPPDLPVLPSPEVSPVRRCQRGSSYRGMQWQSEEASEQYTPPPVLLSQLSGDESQMQSAPDDTGSSYQEETTLTLDDTFEGSIDIVEDVPRPDMKYIVFESCLLLLLRICAVCAGICDVSLSYFGTCITATTSCRHNPGHRRKWSSQPFVGRKPKGNIDLSAAILFTGLHPTPTLRMLRSMKVQVFEDRTFYSYQRAYLLPVVHAVWTQHQALLLASLQGKVTDLCGDGRCDSPGFSAKFLTYSFLSQSLGKIIHTEQVQVRENTRVQASTNMEKEALIRGLAFLEEKAITIGAFVTDRHPGIRAYLRDHCPGIQHYFDIWHVAKGVQKKLRAAAKNATCQELSQWVQPISNHLYACASACADNADFAVAMWKSAANHACNVHHGHSSTLYTRCLHKPSGPRAWLTAGSPPHRRLEGIINAHYLLRDIRQLSPKVQTFSIESFHSVLNGFATKSVAFTYEGMKARTLIAVLHFNENTKRPQAVTAEGEGKLHVKTPKGRGATVATEVKTDPTFGYVCELQSGVLERCEALPSFKEALAQVEPPMPPSFAPSAEERLPTKLIAAQQRIRFQKD
ncbi:uncharacterized protein LOC144168961 [Haemaphysalis longicornis]